MEILSEKSNHIVMKEKDLKDMSRRELITLIIKLNKKVNKKFKPTQKIVIVDDTNLFLNKGL